MQPDGLRLLFYFERFERRTFSLRFGSDRQNLPHPSPERSARCTTLSDRKILRKYFLGRAAQENFQPGRAALRQTGPASATSIAQMRSKKLRSKKRKARGHPRAFVQLWSIATRGPPQTGYPLPDWPDQHVPRLLVRALWRHPAFRWKHPPRL